MRASGARVWVDAVAAPSHPTNSRATIASDGARPHGKRVERIRRGLVSEDSVGGV